MRMRHLLAGVLAVAVCGSLGRAEEEKPTLVGEWEAITATQGGQARAAMNFEGMRWTFGKETLEITPAGLSPAGRAGKPPLKCTYAVDDAKSPAHFHWTILGEGDKKMVTDAIYELKGDVLRVCFAQRGLPRPASFETKKGESLYEFKRVVKAK